MNKIIGVILIILSSCYPQEDVQAIEVYSVDLNIETPYRIKCSDFFGSFSEDIVKIQIDDKTKIQHFLNELKKLENIKESVAVDTRAKVFIKYKSHTDTLCVDNFTVAYRNNFFKLSNELRKTLRN